MNKEIPEVVQPDIMAATMSEAFSFSNSLTLLESAKPLTLKAELIREIEKEITETEQQKIECWCGKDTICANCLRENEIRRRAGKKGFYFKGDLLGGNPEKKTK